MQFIIGIDEVGRGSLAGPVAVCAACVPTNLRLTTKNLGLGKLRDSKKLSEAQRERWFSYFASSEHIRYELARVYPKKIDKINISRAANLAAYRALTRLISRHRVNIKKCAVFLDGGLYVGNRRRLSRTRFAEARRVKTRINADTIRVNLRGNPRISAFTVVKGDEKIDAIKIASIIAKVKRDRGMKRLSNIFPGYGFEIHKGYGTKRHIQAIKKLGLSPIHRLTFLRKYIKLAVSD